MPRLSLWGVMPDLMLLVVVSWNLLRGAREGIVWALGGGLLLDLLSSGPFGVATISVALASLLAGLGELNIFQGSPWLPPAASILATIVYYTTYLIILRISGRPLQWTPTMLQVVVPAVLLNVLLMYPVYWIMGWLHKRTSSEKIKW